MEIRQIWTINDYVDFPYCGQVAYIERYREELKSEKIHTETVYAITSLSKHEADGRLLDVARGHWDIENRSHYVRDVTFDEDRSKVRTKSGPLMMSTLRKFSYKHAAISWTFQYCKSYTSDDVQTPSGIKANRSLKTHFMNYNQISELRF